MSPQVGPLDRGLQVLEELSRAGRSRPADLTRSTGLARATIDRIVTTLVEIGYLRWEGRDVVLAPRLMELGNAYLAGSGLSDALVPLAVDLADSLDESVSLAVPDQGRVRFISQSPRRRHMSIVFKIGDLLPPERCAAGTVFATAWDEAEWERWSNRPVEEDERFISPPDPSGFPGRVLAAQADGFALDDQLVEPGLIAIAFPLRDAQGTVVCALSVVSHTSRHTVESLRDQVMPTVTGCVQRMEKAIKSRPPRSSPSNGVDRSRAAKLELGPDFLQSLGRGLAVLAAVGGGRTLSEAAEATGLPRATARRALLTFQELGYVRERGRRFDLLPRVLDLGFAGLSSLSFEEIAQPHLALLTAEVEDSASMAVLDGDDIRYVVRVPTSRIMRVTVAVGTRFPAHVTSTGRVLLADREDAEERLARADLRPFTPFTKTSLDDLRAAISAVRQAGYALVDQELEEGLRSMAVPIRNRSGQAMAAINVATHSGRCTPEETVARLIQPLFSTAAAIERDLAVFTERCG